jgi:integrase
MATIKFYINSKDPQKEYTINLFLRNGRKGNFKKSTGYKIIDKHWDSIKEAPKSESKTGDKNYYLLRRKLPQLKAKLIEAVTVANYKDVLIDGDWLEDQINIFFGRETLNLEFKYFSDYAKHFIERAPYRIKKGGETGLKPRTTKKYKTTLNKVLEFEKLKKKRFKIDDINLKFHGDFIQFLNKNQNLNLNTVGKYIKCLKTILNNAKQNGVKVNLDIDKDAFRSTSQKTYFVTLNEIEIDKIFNLNLSNTLYLKNARDWFILALWTGTRVSDLLNFTMDNINDEFLEYTAKKTNQKIMIPLHWQVKSTLDQNEGKFPYKISYQRYNDWIKRVCEKAGINQIEKGAIFVNDQKENDKKLKTPQRKKVGQYPKWKMISTHTARRSFATNHYGKLPTPVIMAATGHTTEKMLLAYIGKTAKDNALVLQEYWQKETRKKTKESNLKIINDKVYS